MGLGAQFWVRAGRGKGSERADGHGGRYVAGQVPGPDTGSAPFLSCAHLLEQTRAVLAPS